MFGKTTELDKGSCFMTHLFEVVKASYPKNSAVKPPLFVSTWVVPMTMAQILRSGVRRKFHAPFCSGGGASDGSVDRTLSSNLDFAKTTSH